MQKATFIFAMSVCVRLSVRMEQLGSHRTDFYETWYLIFFRKSVWKIQVSYQPEKKMGTLRKDISTYIAISRWIILIRRNISNKIIEKIKTHLHSVTFFAENRAVYEKISKNKEQPERPQATIGRHVACWMTKATRAQNHPLPCTQKKHAHTQNNM